MAVNTSKQTGFSDKINKQTSDSTEQWVKWKCCPVNATTSKVGKKAGGATLRHTKQNHKVEGVSYRHRLDTPCLIELHTHSLSLSLSLSVWPIYDITLSLKTNSLISGTTGPEKISLISRSLISGSNLYTLTQALIWDQRRYILYPGLLYPGYTADFFRQPWVAMTSTIVKTPVKCPRCDWSQMTRNMQQEIRSHKIRSLKSSAQCQMTTLTAFCKEADVTTEASYVIAWNIARSKRPYTDG